MIDLGDVNEILDVLEGAGLDVWLDGGWGVDALLGEPTRAHDDLDLIADIADDARLRAALGARGFREVRGTPTNYVVRDRAGREVDVHLARFEPDGRAVYRTEAGEDWVFPADASTTGALDGRPVVCLTAEEQMRGHAAGYEPGETDHHDMRLLHDRLGTELAGPYRLISRARSSGSAPSR